MANRQADRAIQRKRPGRRAATAGLETEHAAMRCRYANGATAIGRMRHRQNARRHDGRRTTR
ncbi:hypothetical protein SDC9_137133 [bioreactor metagenome]|uniref:Uncharacterized protein n=1 Tax=bioreactor metagenome TaxID=1076179 RepID=A0A645DL64_9ZZZZ